MGDETLIGIDIGTTSVKAVMIDFAGRRLAAMSTPYPTARPGPGLVEQTPDDWLDLVIAALTAFGVHPMRGSLRAVGITSQVNTHVFVDRDLNPLAPAIVWQDVRAAAAGAALDAGIDPGDKIAWLGAPIPIDASHALARMAWMERAHPDIWARTGHVMAPKDYVIARLTGRVLADPIASVGLVGPDLRYADALIARLPGAAARLAPLADPLDVAGAIRADLPLAGVPLVVGTMDAWASMFGLGVAGDGQAMYLSGTSEVIGLISPARHGEPGVITFPQWAGLTLHAGPTQAGGASLDWAARLFGQTAASLASTAAPITATTPLFLPHLQGERAPLWDAEARGVFAGLSAATGPGDMAAAVLEGVAFSARLALEALERSGGLRPEILNLGGGGATSDRWCQIRADALARPLVRMQGRDPGAVGAAVLAGVGCGAILSIADAARNLVVADRTFAPAAAAASVGEHRFKIWSSLYDSMRPVNTALAAERTLTT